MAKFEWSQALAMVIMVVTMSGFGVFNQHFVEAFPEEDMVVELPNQPKVSFRQFSGYVDVDVEAERSLFYYFVEAVNETIKKPLTLWLNGGPGCSSVGGGAFTELGPFYPTGDGRGLRVNSMSWNKVSNLLFVDSPAGVGWSYSNRSSDYNTGDESTANDMLVFLLRWFEKFPELKSRDLFLTGESYAGHYIPQLAEKILHYNSNSSSTGFKFNLQGIAIGNPLLRLDTDFPAQFEFLWSHGLISDELQHSIKTGCNFANVSKSCKDSIGEVTISISKYVHNFDVLLDQCYPLIVQQELRLRKMVTKISLGVDVCITYERSDYFNLPKVQKALHANRTHLPYEWSMCSNFLRYSGTDGSMDMLPVLKRIIQKKIPLMIFSGDQDSVIPLIGSRTLVRELAHDLNFKITAPYGAWFHKGQVGGWRIEYGDLLTFATVRGAGHAVPYAQPSRALHMFRSFVGGKRLH